MDDKEKAIYFNYRTVENDLAALLRAIDLTDANYSVNSAEIRKIILASCSMIESCVPSLKAAISPTATINNGESIANFIDRITKEQGYNLENVAPLLQFESFSPWTKPLSWWDAYNAVKHPKRDQTDIQFFKAAIDSVLALFILALMLTRKTSIGIFWHDHDLVKISEKGSNKPINYAAQTTLEKILGWNKNDA